MGAPVLKLSEGTPLQKHHELGETSSRTEEIPQITGGSIIIFLSTQVTHQMLELYNMDYIED